VTDDKTMILQIRDLT